jgi:hypothetical protein
MCLEAHKHKGTTFQGTQISTISSLKDSHLIFNTYSKRFYRFDFPLEDYYDKEMDGHDHCANNEEEDFTLKFQKDISHSCNDEYAHEYFQELELLPIALEGKDQCFDEKVVGPSYYEEVVFPNHHKETIVQEKYLGIQLLSKDMKNLLCVNEFNNVGFPFPSSRNCNNKE